MTVQHTRNKIPLAKYIFMLLFLLCSTAAFTQQFNADSLKQLLATEKKDTDKVRLMWQLADVLSLNNIDTALQVSQNALFLARRIKYAEGESRALGISAKIYRKEGNYQLALEYNLKKLELEEKRNNPRNLASVLMNIGIVYIFQDEYRKGLQYYSMSDSVINLYNLADLKYNIALNLGDAYNRLNIADSAYVYFDKSLQIAQQQNDFDYIGTSMTGLGHTYLKKGNYAAALVNYQTAMNYLKAAGDDDIFCEAALGLASLHQKNKHIDSAIHYASISLATAKKDRFLSHQFAAAELLSSCYKQIKKIDSAFAYTSYAKSLNDSIYSHEKIRQLQIISSNEQRRQIDIEENKKIAKAERSQQLQLLFIGIFIPGLFLLTILLSRVKVHVKLVRLLGVLSLLITSEYLTLLLHPYVSELTHHTPAIEILIYVVVAAILIPSHHRIEHWLIELLTRNHHHQHQKKDPSAFQLTTKKLKIKGPSG